MECMQREEKETSWNQGSQIFDFAEGKAPISRKGGEWLEVAEKGDSFSEGGSEACLCYRGQVGEEPGTVGFGNWVVSGGLGGSRDGATERTETSLLWCKEVRGGGRE